jgi:hypothetical protein
MSYGQKEIDASIALAEEAAESEMKLDRASNANPELPGIEQFTENTLAFAGGLYAKLVDNPLAQQLLPQARMIVRIRASRRDAIDAISFGELMLVSAGQRAVEEGHLVQEEVIDPPFSNESQNLDWHEFLGAITNGNKGLALIHLNSLLAAVREDLVNADLPAAAPAYKIPD